MSRPENCGCPITTSTQNMNNLLSTYRAWKVTENTPVKPPDARCIISLSQDWLPLE